MLLTASGTELKLAELPQSRGERTFYLGWSSTELDPTQTFAGAVGHDRALDAEPVIILGVCRRCHDLICRQMKTRWLALAGFR